MKKYEIWVEGFSVTGQHEKASLLDTIMAESWDDAVKKYMELNPGRIDIRTLNGKKIYTDWGCKLFDNEKDARKSFG
jgi:hypothetical protein